MNHIETDLGAETAAARPLVQESFIVPEFENDLVRLEPLTSADADADYALIMEPKNRAHLEGVLVGFDDEWPRPDFTFPENLADLVHHEATMQRREDFAWKIIRKGDGKYIGCFYLQPPHTEGSDVDVYMWVDAATAEAGDDTPIFEALRQWVEEKWPFKRVAYPGLRAK